MILIYNSTGNLYLSIEDYLTTLAAEIAAAEESGEDLENVYRAIFLMNLDDLFTMVKKRTAQRGRFAKGEQGQSLLENFAMTDDERDFFDDAIKTGAAEVFRKMSGWSKDIDEAYRHGKTFGEPVESGIAEIVSSNVITDSSLALTPDALIGYKLVITSAGPMSNEERTITDNDETSITLSSAFDSDVTGLEFAVCPQTDLYIIYYIGVASTWDSNMLQGIENAIQEALVRFILKEWYLTNRYMDDFTIENELCSKELDKIRSQLIHHKTPVRRPLDMFS